MDEQIQIQMGDYVFTQKYCLGQGSFGKVYRGKNIRTNRQVAIKQMDGKLITQQQIGRQITILKQLKHHNIVEYQDAFQNNGYFYIVTEYCNGGDLRNLFDSSDQQDVKEKEKKILEMFWQVCEGFCYLRKFDIIHRDLKPSNIFIHNGMYKIADFGLAKRENVHKSVIHQQIMGVPVYMSPQILSKNYYTYKCDVWSLGIIIFEMLYDHHPWKAQDIQTLFFQIMNYPQPYKDKHQSHHPIFNQIFKNTLTYLQKQRKSWQQLLLLKSQKSFQKQKLTKSISKSKKQQNSLSSKYDKTISKEQYQILRHLFSQINSLQSQLIQLTNKDCLKGLILTIQRYSQDGVQCKGMLRDCCFIFLKLVANNLHLQLMQYEQLQQSRQLLIFIQLLHDFVYNSDQKYTITKETFQKTLRNRAIAQFAASVISKINTLLLYNDAKDL